MSRSNREERETKGGGYGSARDRAEKAGSGSRSAYLKMPSGVKMFKPKAGIFLLDIVPFVAGAGNPFADEGMKYYERTFYIHRSVGPGEEMVLCPRKTSGSKCPICEHRMALSRSDDPDDEIQAKELEPKQRQLFNLINRREPDAGVMLWDISYHLFGDELDKSIRASDEEDGWDAFFHLKKGFTLKVSMEDDSYGGRAFVRAGRIDFKSRQDYDVDILEQTHCLDELLVEMEYNDLKKLYLGTEAETDERRTEADEPDERPKKKHREEEPEEEPRGKRREREEEPEEEPRRKSRSAEPEEDEPKGKGKKDDWEDFDEDKPKGKHKEEEPEEEPRRRSRSAEPEEEEPKSRRRQPEPEEDEPKPKSKKGDDEWDDFDKPKGKREPEPEEEEPKRRKRDPEPEEEEPKSRSRSRR